jgi:hypothetical protein
MTLGAERSEGALASIDPLADKELCASPPESTE